MEFASRDRYRHVVERISKGVKVSELKVAAAAVGLAEHAAASRERTRAGLTLATT